MSTNYSDRFGYEPKLPEDIRIIFMWLCQDVGHIRQLWNFYIELFTSEDYVNVADLVPATFLILEETVRNDLVMSICRLNDPPKSIKRENLSFRTIAPKCAEIEGIEKLVESFSAACEPIQKLRNKRVAHNDLNTRIDLQINLEQMIGRQQIDEILHISEKILNTIIQKYVDTEIMFEPIQIGGAKNLLFWLKAGKQYHEDQDRKLRGIRID